MRPRPNQTTSSHKFRSSSFSTTHSPPLRNSSYLMHRSHLLAEIVGLYWCQTGMDVLACAHGVERDQGTAVRMWKSAVDFSCHAKLWFCWKNAVSALYLFSPCLLVCFRFCLSPSQRFSESSNSDFLLPFSPSPSLNNLLRSMATGLFLALSNLSPGEC